MHSQQTSRGLVRRFIGIEEHIAMKCLCCDAVNVDMRHARTCPQAEAQVNQHRPLLHTVPRALKRLGISHHVESGESLKADRNLRIDIAVRRGGSGFSEQGILSYWTSPTQARKSRHSCGEKKVATIDHLPQPARRACTNTTLVWDKVVRQAEPQTRHFLISRWKTLDVSGQRVPPSSIRWKRAS